MLQVSSAMKGYTIEANDGSIGTIDDFLFDQSTWTVRWLVVDTGTWLTTRMVLVHPSAVGQVDHERREITVALTKKQVEDSPDIGKDRPVSQQMQNDLYGYYGWDPVWGAGMFGAGLYGGGMYDGGLYGDGLTGGSVAPGGAIPAQSQAASRHGEVAVEEGDPNLRSMAEVSRYHLHAADGSIGHVEDVLLDAPSWGIRYLVINTSNWWLGQHVLISPYAVTDIDWSDRSIRLDITQAKVRASPTWDPADLNDEAFERRLHEHYGWPGYGW
jgi:hypothetical protein